jgi:hypothetical protein
LALFKQFMLKKYTGVFVLLMLVVAAKAQRGGRIGLVTGVTSISLRNADDAKANENVLKNAPTLGFHKGIEVGYNWRYFGVYSQFNWMQNGQNYRLGSNYANTRLNYFRPTVLFSVNSNPRKRIRFSAQLGAAYGILNNYKEYSNTISPTTLSQVYTEYNNTSYMQVISNDTITGNIGKGIYFKNDISAIIALGAEFRFAPNWIVGLHARVDYGLENLENYDRTTITYKQSGVTGEFKSDYEHWRYTPSKFSYDPFYFDVRKPSQNMSMGGFLSVKYILESKQILQYEMDGW